MLSIENKLLGGAGCKIDDVFLPLHQLFHSVFSFFRSERREGCADRNQQLAYFLMDTNPVGFLMIYIANKIRKE